MIWLGLRTKGLVFSGDKEDCLACDKWEDCLVGECVGVVARTVAGDALFWRRKGDCRAVVESKGEMRGVELDVCTDDEHDMHRW